MQKPSINFVLGTVVKMNDPAVKELAKPTAVKTPGEEKSDADIEAEAEAEADFKESNRSESELPGTEYTEPAEPQKKKIPADIIRQSAEATTIAIDTGINLGVPFLYKLRAFTGTERRVIRKHQQIFKARFRAEEKGKSVEFELFNDSEDLENLYHDWCEFNEFVNGLSASEKKLKAISDAWERIFEYYQKDPGPWAQLGMAYANAYGEVVTPLFSF